MHYPIGILTRCRTWGSAELLFFGKLGGQFGSGAMSVTTQLTTLSGTTTVGSAFELGTEAVLGAFEPAAVPLMVAAPHRWMSLLTKVVTFGTRAGPNRPPTWDTDRKR